MIQILLVVLIVLVYVKIDYSKYIVLKCVIPNRNDLGGFAWHLHHVQCLIDLCKKENKIPIVNFNGGYYHNYKYGLEWYTHYFEPLNNQDVSFIVFVGDVFGYNKIDKIPINNNTKLPYIYTNDTFQKLIRDKYAINFNECYKYIIPKQHIVSKIENFKKLHFKDKYVIGVHYRGTDKFMAMRNTEDMMHSKHKNYQEVVNEIKNEIQKYKNVVVFVASDEQPFVDICKKQFDSVCCYDAIRSSISTSGIELNTKECVNFTENADCKKLKKIQKQSIHRGHKKIDPYKKGEDVVIEIWLLSNCNVFFRTHGGNFGSQPKRINKNLKVIDLL